MQQLSFIAAGMEKIAQAIVKNAVKWTPSGVGLYGVADSISKGDPKQAVLLSFVTACSSVWVKFSGQFMEETEKEAEKRGGSFAQGCLWGAIAPQPYLNLNLLELLRLNPSTPNTSAILNGTVS
jgi:hypothetical protein